MAHRSDDGSIDNMANNRGKSDGIAEGQSTTPSSETGGIERVSGEKGDKRDGVKMTAGEQGDKLPPAEAGTVEHEKQDTERRTDYDAPRYFWESHAYVLIPHHSQATTTTPVGSFKPVDDKTTAVTLKVATIWHPRGDPRVELRFLLHLPSGHHHYLKFYLNHSNLDLENCPPAETMQAMKRRSPDEYNAILRKFRASAEQVEAVGKCGVLYVKMAHVRRDRFVYQAGCYEVDDEDDLEEHFNTVQRIRHAFSTKWDIELLVVDKDFARHFAHVMDEIKRRRDEESIRRSTPAKEPPKAKEPPQPATTLPTRPKTYEEYLTTVVCFNCNTQGHLARHCKRPKPPYCQDCKVVGHKIDDCNVRLYADMARMGIFPSHILAARRRAEEREREALARGGERGEGDGDGDGEVYAGS